MKKSFLFFLLFALMTIHWTSCYDSEKNDNASVIKEENGLTKSTTTKKKHEIVKITKIKDVLENIDENTLVVFDIDVTLLWVPNHTWPYDNVGSTFLAEGNDTLKMWQELLQKTSNDKKTGGAKFIFLTARRALENAEKDLNDAGLIYQTTWANDFAKSFDEKNHRGYLNGVIYAAHLKKSYSLTKFLDEARPYFSFKKIIFVDDRKDNVDDIHEILKTLPEIDSSFSYWYVGAIHPDTGKIIAAFALYTLFSTQFLTL